MFFDIRLNMLLKKSRFETLWELCDNTVTIYDWTIAKLEVEINSTYVGIVVEAVIIWSRTVIHGQYE